MRLFPLCSLAALLFLAACTSSVPTAQRLDELEQQIRAEHQVDYADLEQRRKRGELSREEYQIARSALDKRVQNRVDTMLWNRHALAQSDRKAHGIPTPDQPIDNTPPEVGGIQNTLYNSRRQTGMGNQLMGNFMRDVGGGNFNSPNRSGTLYDPN
jgi:hypothetical protein